MGNEVPTRDPATYRPITLHWEETPEEKHERINQILERNTKPDTICVGCGLVIFDEQSLIETAHGAYHGAPKNCVDGREEKDIPWWQK